MINNNYTNPAFKGYKNIISNDIKGDDFRISFIVGQLYDDSQFKDLSEYKTIKELSGHYADSLEDDTFSCLYGRFNSKELIFFNKDSMYWGDELRNLKYKLPLEEYKKEESATLKTYQLLASISKRMMCNGLCKQDKDLAKVFRYTFERFTQMFGTQKNAYTLLHNSVLRNSSLEKIGLFFNRGIAHTMKDFFK